MMVIGRAGDGWPPRASTSGSDEQAKSVTFNPVRLLVGAYLKPSDLVVLHVEPASEHEHVVPSSSVAASPPVPR
jgi:hypothetical protein